MPDSALDEPITASSKTLTSVLKKSFSGPWSVKAFLRSITQAKTSSLAIAFLMSLPLFTLVVQAFVGEGESFQHIKETVLSDYIYNII